MTTVLLTAYGLAGSLTPATGQTDHVQYLPATCPKLPAFLLDSSVMAGSRSAAGGRIVSW